MNTTRSLADVLRAAADFLTEHPALPSPYITTGGTETAATVDLNWFLTIGGNDLAEQKSRAAQIVRAVGGEWKKINYGPADDNFIFRQERDGLQLDVLVKREAVCERIVTGVETVTVPAKAAEPERTEEREVVEWRCEPLLAEVSA